MCGCATGMSGSPNTNVLPIKFDESKSYVYFYRPCMIWGAARGITVYDGEESIAGLDCSTFYIYETIPGEHNFHADDWIRKERILAMDLQAGKKYFVKADLRIGIIDAVPSLTLMDNIDEIGMSQFKQVAGRVVGINNRK
jgi:hypothetical protein